MPPLKPILAAHSFIPNLMSSYLLSGLMSLLSEGDAELFAFTSTGISESAFLTKKSISIEGFSDDRNIGHILVSPACRPRYSHKVPLCMFRDYCWNEDHPEIPCRAMLSAIPCLYNRVYTD